MMKEKSDDGRKPVTVVIDRERLEAYQAAADGIQGVTVLVSRDQVYPSGQPVPKDKVRLGIDNVRTKPGLSDFWEDVRSRT
jgi:hypothetical protein